MKLKIEDIMFWILIALIVGMAIWKLIGSPTDTASLISLALFVAGSEVLIWKSIFKIDKNTSLGFMKVKHDLDLMENKIMNKLNNIENRIK
ncbi:MAG: hypothetical protein Q8N63_03205 [Nanoarchaeota archaeon]|nr:hypothetical protein [Nanoarchaeota archaeon]